MIDGVVKFENDEVLLIITERGERYQLQKSAIADIGTPKEEAVVVEDKASGNPFGALINVGAGFAVLQINIVPILLLTLLWGTGCF